MRNKYSLVFLIIILFSCKKRVEQNSFSPTSQTISQYITKVKEGKYTLIEKENMLGKAYETLLNIKEDSLRKVEYLNLVYAYYQLPNSKSFNKLNLELIELSKKTKDTAVLAKCYWRLGNFFSVVEIKNDSAYYYYDKGQKLYDQIENEFNAARLLMNMAITQQIVKDYTGSEITTIRAIKKFKHLKKNKQLYSCYNNLAIISNELTDYDRSLYYHQKALEYLKKANLNQLTPVTLNNIGVVFENQGKHKLAIEEYKIAMNYDSLLEKDPELYAMLMDNLAYAQFQMGDFQQLPKLFYDALEIRERLEITSGITVNKLHLAEYFLSKKDTIKAKEFALAVKRLSKQSNNFQDLLSSLLILANIEKNNAYDYMTNYVELNDSLQKEERATRNKFARIRFETDEYISETERLHNRIASISLLSLGVIVILIMIYIIINQRSKNVKLRLIQQRQLANQEVYNLILSQQQKFEEVRENEKHRISRELHDGILGRLFGIRLSLDSLNNDDSQDIKKKRSNYVKEIKNIAEEIRLMSHKLDRRSSIEISFVEVLHELIKQQNEGLIKFKLLINESVSLESLEDNIKINIYRIIQEAIQNIQKHSNATNANIHIRKTKKILILLIEDNGKGFDLTRSIKGLGLRNMKARAKSIKANLNISSLQSNTGTRVRLTLAI